MIYHICADEDWQEALSSGMYAPISLINEGFIHCSTASQVAAVANAFYAGRHDLVLLVIDTAAVAAILRYEAPVHPSGGQPPADQVEDLYPHLYGPLPVSAVSDWSAFAPGPDGLFLYG